MMRNKRFTTMMNEEILPAIDRKQSLHCGQQQT